MESTPSDVELIGAVSEGDRGALAELYRRYGALIGAVGHRMLHARGDADDLLHDVFLAVWLHAHEYDVTRGTVRAWIMMRARSRALDRIKAPGYSRSIPLDPTFDVAAPERGQNAGVGFDASVVVLALDALSDDQRVVIEMGYFEGLSLAEIAVRLDVPVGTIKSRLSRALKSLREVVARARDLNMDLWVRLRHLELTWAGLGAMVFAFLGVLFLRRLLPESRRERGRLSALLLGIAPLLHLLATGIGLLGLSTASAMLHLTNVGVVITGGTGVIGMIVFDILLGRSSLPTIARDLTQIVVFTGIVLVVLRSGGLDPTSLLTTSAVATAVLGLALQNVLSNVIAGLVLQLDRTFALGDWIQVGARVGRITEIKWRSSSMITREGDTAILPNALLLSTEVVNLSHPTRTQRITVRIPFHHKHSPGEVSAAVLSAVRESPGVLHDPPPSCAPADFLPSALLYSVSFWIENAGVQGVVEATVRSRLWYAAERAGLEGPCPPALRLQSGGDESTDAERAELNRRMIALDDVAILAPLDEMEKARMARSMARRRFAEGERILRQGDAGSSLFVVVAGAVKVAVEDEHGVTQLADLGPGAWFGEMSLLTGDPRQATCVAGSEVSCLELPASVFRRIVSEHPAVADEIAALVSARQIELAGTRDGTNRATTHDAASEKDRLLRRVRDYFRLG